MNIKKIYSFVLVVLLSISLVFPPYIVSASNIDVFNLLPLGTILTVSSDIFVPFSIKGMKINRNNPLEFNFIIDTGHQDHRDKDWKIKETGKLVNYFLTVLTVHEENLWVNLSIYEKDRIIEENFGKTEMGRDLLLQDYLLKQFSASLIHPEGKLGEKFWKEIRKQSLNEEEKEAFLRDTFHKIWILPDEVEVSEGEDSVYITKSTLKVMLDKDYLAMQKTNNDLILDKYEENFSTNIMKKIIVPVMEKEINEGKHFANLRQIYNSLILANWYKKTVKNKFLTKVYIGKNKVKGIDINSDSVNKAIYEKYIDSYKQGVFHYVKEDYDEMRQEISQVKYFSGGFFLKVDPSHLVTTDGEYKPKGGTVYAKTTFVPVFDDTNPAVLAVEDIVKMLEESFGEYIKAKKEGSRIISTFGHDILNPRMLNFFGENIRDMIKELYSEDKYLIHLRDFLKNSNKFHDSIAEVLLGKSSSQEFTDNLKLLELFVRGKGGLRDEYWNDVRPFMQAIVDRYKPYFLGTLNHWNGLNVPHVIDTIRQSLEDMNKYSHNNHKLSHSQILGVLNDYSNHSNYSNHSKLSSRRVLELLTSFNIDAVEIVNLFGSLLQEDKDLRIELENINKRIVQNNQYAKKNSNNSEFFGGMYVLNQNGKKVKFFIVSNTRLENTFLYEDMNRKDIIVFRLDTIEYLHGLFTAYMKDNNIIDKLFIMKVVSGMKEILQVLEVEQKSKSKIIKQINEYVLLNKNVVIESVKKLELKFSLTQNFENGVKSIIEELNQLGEKRLDNSNNVAGSNPKKVHIPLIDIKEIMEKFTSILNEKSENTINETVLKQVYYLLNNPVNDFKIVGSTDISKGLRNLAIGSMDQDNIKYLLGVTYQLGRSNHNHKKKSNLSDFYLLLNSIFENDTLNKDFVGKHKNYIVSVLDAAIKELNGYLEISTDNANLGGINFNKVEINNKASSLGVEYHYNDNNQHTLMKNISGFVHIINFDWK